MNNKTFIIAEAGVNHNGQLELAKQLVDVACKSQADAVKFQTFKAEKISIKNIHKADYQKQTTSSDETQFDMLKRLELSEDDFKHLFQYCQNKEILFLSSPFDVESVDFLYELGMNIFKIPSGEITNYLLLKRIGSLKQEIILSSGMSTLDEIQEALNVLISAGTLKGKIIVLHCNTEYPTPFEDVNLNAMLTIKNQLDIQVGYSDHTLGIEVPIAAVALGAKIIEKHFTLNKDLSGPDHKASLNPEELKNMIKAIRNIEKSLGDGDKKPSPSELKNKDLVRKSIVAVKDIKKGDLFTEENITVKRPGTGLSPMNWEKIIGQKALKDFKKDQFIEI